jgi:hypothetical protein
VREAACGRRGQAAPDVLLVLLAGLAEVRVEVHERGHDEEALAVDDARALGPPDLVGRRAGADPRELAVLDHHVDDGIEIAGGIDGAHGVENNQAHRAVLPTMTTMARREAAGCGWAKPTVGGDGTMPALGQAMIETASCQETIRCSAPSRARPTQARPFGTAGLSRV